MQTQYRLPHATNNRRTSISTTNIHTVSILDTALVACDSWISQASAGEHMIIGVIVDCTTWVVAAGRKIGVDDKVIWVSNGATAGGCVYR